MTDVAKRSAIKTQHGDLGTPQFKSHHCVEIEVRDRHANGESKIIGGRVKDQTPMDRYYTRRQLDKNGDVNYILFQAGERLLADFYYAGLLAKTTSSYEPRIKTFYNFMEHREDRIKSYKKAMQNVGQSVRAILVHVCCLQGFANEWALKHGQKSDAGLIILRMALHDLAIHYGMLKNDIDAYH